MRLGRRQCDVAVVGAGLAGLVAATELFRRGQDVLVVEARDRVGGRILNAELSAADGDVVEMGGQWVGPTQERLLGLIDELGLRTFPTYDTGQHIVELGGRLRRYSGRIPRLSPLALADIGQCQLLLDRASRRVPVDSPWEAPDASALDGETFAAWIRRRARTRLGRAFLRLTTQAVFAAEPEDVSTLWVQFYVASAGGLDRLINTSGGAQQDRIVGGSQRIALALAERLPDRVVLGEPVREIHCEVSGAVVHAEHIEVAARRVIVATPPAMASRIRYRPPLPSERDQLWQRLPMGAVVKVNLVYDRPFWRARGLSGQVNSDGRLVGTVFDNSPPDGARGVLVGFVEGRNADVASRLSPSDRRAAVIDDVAAYFGPEARAVTAYLEVDWAGEEFTRGCYGAFAAPMALTRFGPALRRPLGPLHWAGSETATRWAGYMDGAVESGQRAAAEVAAALTSGGGDQPQ